MAHYCVIDPDSGIVESVFVGRDEDDLAPGVDDWEMYYAPAGKIVKRTSYNTYGGVHYTDGEPSADQSKALRYNFAGPGWAYDETRDAFIPPKPIEGEWELNESTCLWVEVVEPSA